MGQGVLKYIKKAGGPEFHQRGIPNSTRGVSSTPPKGCPKFLQKDVLIFTKEQGVLNSTKWYLSLILAKGCR